MGIKENTFTDVEVSHGDENRSTDPADK